MTNDALRALGFDVDRAWRGAREQDGLSRYQGCSSLAGFNLRYSDPAGEYFCMRTIQKRAQRKRKQDADDVERMGAVHTDGRLAGADEAIEVRGDEDDTGRDHLPLEEGGGSLDDLEGAPAREGD